MVRDDGDDEDNDETSKEPPMFCFCVCSPFFLFAVRGLLLAIVGIRYRRPAIY